MSESEIDAVVGGLLEAENAADAIAAGWKCIWWQVTKLVSDPHTPVV